MGKNELVENASKCKYSRQIHNIFFTHLRSDFCILRSTTVIRVKQKTKIRIAQELMKNLTSR